MRPYLAGSYNNPGLPNGLIFKGISTEGKRYIGGSAAQREGRPKSYRQTEAECVFPMVIVSILPHAEFGANDHREDASGMRHPTLDEL